MGVSTVEIDRRFLAFPHVGKHTSSDDSHTLAVQWRNKSLAPVNINAVIENDAVCPTPLL